MIIEVEEEGVLQCPNCGKEAINVNGKFVCLDCGVELSLSGSSTTPPESTVLNHGDRMNNNTVIPPSELKLEPIPDVTASDLPSPQPEPVKEGYLNELKSDNPDTPGNYDFEQPNFTPTPTLAPSPTPAPMSEPPVTAPESTVPAEVPKPETYFKPETVDITPKPPVPTEKALNNEQLQNNSNFDAFSTPSGIGPGEPLIEELEGPKAGIVSTPAASVGDETQIKQEAQELFVNETPKEELPVTSMPAADIGLEQAPKNPTLPDQQTPIGANLDDLLDSYSAPQTEGNMPPITMPPPLPAFDSVQPVNQTYSNEAVPVNPYQMAQPETSTQADNSFGTNQMPGTANLPTAESVFGPQPGDGPEQLSIARPSGNKKKKIIIISIVSVVAVLVLAGLVFLGISLTKPKNVKPDEQKQQDETFQISQEVSSVMDLPLNMIANFDQSIDFSKVSVKTIEGADASNTEVLKLLFEKPVIAKGIWQTDTNGNITSEETYNNLSLKKTYLNAEKSTYIYSLEADNWSKIDGDQIQEIPAFYPPKRKDALFYSTEVNSITENDQEEIEGTNYRKMKIVPKADIVESALTGSNTIFSTTTYNSLNLDNLEVFAWVTESGQIFKITINGDVVVDSNLYNGTVTINSTVTYKYQDVTIEKPEIPES